MNDLRNRLDEARLLRDSARDILEADLDYIKILMQPQRIAERLEDDAEIVTEKVGDFARRYPLPLAIAGIGGLLWLFRKPLLGFVRSDSDDNADKAPENI
ncbi:MAG: hypothetical protein ACK5NN_01740 [Sphingomonadaceae bacterium]